MKNNRNLFIVGIIGCIIYVIADFLYAFTGKNDTSEEMGFMIKIAYLNISNWRMSASITCGFIGTLFFYMGFHQMYKVLKLRLNEPNNIIYVKLFRVAYIAGSVAWVHFHSMFMNVALIFKLIYENYGDMKVAANIANKIARYNMIPMIVSFILCDLGFTVIMIILIWKKIIPISSFWKRILATLCNPLMCPGVIGNILAYFPWPINQLDYGTESFGHALVLFLGLILFDSMEIKDKDENYKNKKNNMKKVEIEK